VFGAFGGEEVQLIMTIDDLGEFGLIERIRKLLPDAASSDVLVGIGDDVAVLDPGGDKLWLATCDVQVEGSHFLRDAISPRDLGRKALAINLSDIASAGGSPRFALMSLGLPRGLDVAFVDELYIGLREEASLFGVDIVGGNLSSVRHGLFIDIFLLGEAPKGEVLLRSGARAGDLLLVTGTLGDAAAGVATLLDPSLTTTPEYLQTAKDRRDGPTPRVREGRLIGASGLAHAMIDLSDGLAGDLGHLCEQSRVGARIVARGLPVAKENRELSASARGDEWHFALHGGEDYELLFAVPPSKAQELTETIEHETGTPVSIVGELLPEGSGIELTFPDGRSVPLEERGWDHFEKGQGGRA
jgi:thiamine-monophosphate kinase